MGGIPTPVWFDRPVISPHAPEDIDNIDEMCDYLEGLVAQEWDKSGIPASRIIVGKKIYNLHFCTRHSLKQTQFPTPTGRETSNGLTREWATG